MFEVVHTHDWHDGPRSGVADFQSRPHLFQSARPDSEDARADADLYLLMPIDEDTFSLVLENWAIWRRWENAFHRKKTRQESHPALPEDRFRWEEIQRLLEGRLVVDPNRALRKKAAFRVRYDPEWSGYGWRPLEVRWDDPS